jgi:5'-nucleotidase / UDP-sugar diphosphatase
VRRLLVLFVGLCGLACSSPGPDTRVHGPLELVLLHTADTHSQLFPWRALTGSADARRGLGPAGTLAEVGGLARLATLIRAERAAEPRVLHLDSGDVFQGSLAFERFRGEPELLAFDALGVDAQAVGNHELDLGAALVEERYRTLARFPLLAANFASDGAGGVAELVEPFSVLDARGLRVGVIGVGNTSSVGLLKERPSALGALARDAAEAVQGAVDALRPLVDLVVVVTHLGLDADHALVRATSGIDLVLGGHQHLTLDEPDEEHDCGGAGEGSVVDAWGSERRCRSRRVPIVHSGAYGKFVGRVALLLDDEPGRLGAAYDPLDGFEVTAVTHALLPVRADVADDPAVAALLEPFRPPLTERLALDDLLAYAPVSLERYGATGGDSPLGNLAAEAARALVDADLALIGASSLRHDLPPGLLDEETLVRVLPFSDAVVRLELTGAALGRVLERAARSASNRDCRTQVHVAGALVRMRCPCAGAACARGFAPETEVPCASDADCAVFGGACGGFGDTGGLCFAPLALAGTYRVATTAYLAGGGSGLFEVSAAPARSFGGEPLHVAIAELLRTGSTCDAASERPDALGCVEAVVRRFGDVCAASGLGDACFDIATDRERALSVCRHLACLDGRVGAARDGRIRLEEP